MFAPRLGLCGAVVIIVFVALFARLAALQTGGFADSESPFGEARLPEPLPAVRGAIRDREGELLRASRAAFDVDVVAALYRDRSVAEACADLALLFAPATAPDRDEVLRRADRDPDAVAEEVLALPCDPLALPPADAARVFALRGAVICAPHGTWLRPEPALRRRPHAALGAAAPRGRAPSRADLRARLAAGATTLGDLLRAGPEDVAARLREETRTLSRLGAELGLGDAEAVRAALADLCRRQHGRVERIIEDRLYDAVMVRLAGSATVDVATVGRLRAVALAAEAAPEFTDAVAAARAMERASAALGAVVAGSADSPPAPRAEGAIDRARKAGLYDSDPVRVRDALAAKATSSSEFDRDAYHDARKLAQMRDDLAAFRGDVLGRGAGFGVVDVVDGPGGLREIGFSLRASFGRDPTKAKQGGSLALLLGDVTNEGVATSGLEARLDGVLRGEAGLVATDERGEAIVLRAPVHGTDVRLTLSSRLQDRLDRLTQRPPSPVGAAVVVDVATGGVLAASTWPRPSTEGAPAAVAELLLAERERLAARRALNAGDASASARVAAAERLVRRSPAVHRAMASAAQSPPGSVFKALTLVAGVKSGAITTDSVIECTTGDRRFFGCHLHGSTDFLSALERSCNVYCYEVGLKTGKAPLIDVYRAAGLFDASPGIASQRESEAMERLLTSGSDDVRNLAIGQGSLSFAPFRVAGVAAAIASGRRVAPHIHAPDGFVGVGAPFADEGLLALTREGLRRVVAGPFGTARRHQRDLVPLKIAGKTGTAQLSTSESTLYAAWFAGFAPFGDGATPKYAFAVMFDRTSKEGADTAPFAGEVVRACYEVLGGGP